MWVPFKMLWYQTVSSLFIPSNIFLKSSLGGFDHISSAFLIRGHTPQKSQHFLITCGRFQECVDSDGE